MKRVLPVVACALALWSTEASAQMPPGSYAQTCRDIRFDGNMLSAVCATAQGMAQRSALRVDSCSGPIANINGQLACPGGGGGRGGRPSQGAGPGYGGGGPSYQGGYERGYGRGYDRDRDDDRDERRYREGPAYGGYPSERQRGGGYGPPPGPPPGYALPQAQPRPSAAPPGAGVPPGSWQATCVKAQMQGTTLTAACRNTQGGYTQSAVDVRSCRSIANMNGRLVCG